MWLSGQWLLHSPDDLSFNSRPHIKVKGEKRTHAGSGPLTPKDSLEIDMVRKSYNMSK